MKPIDEPPNVLLCLSSSPENVVLVRETLTGVAEAVDLDGAALNDIRTAVTEACNNVSLHAYGGREGPLEVEISQLAGPVPGARALEITVRDQGTGIKPRIRPPNGEALGLGMSLIQALTSRVEFADSGGGGTQVTMEFPTPGARELDSRQVDRLERPAMTQADIATTTGVTIAPAALARTVLPRVLILLAARADLSTDRIADLQALADVLAAQPLDSLDGGQLSLAVSASRRRLDLVVGPLEEGAARRMIVGSAVEGLGPLMERLTDERHVASDGDSESLSLSLIEAP